jgi:hypothetical protein
VTDPTVSSPNYIHPAFAPNPQPNYIWGDATLGTDTIVASSMGVDESALPEQDDARDAHFLRADSSTTLGTVSGVTMERTVQSGTMLGEPTVVAGSHFVAYSQCESLGRCDAAVQKAGSSCKSGRGYCYESASGSLECGRTIKTWKHHQTEADAITMGVSPVYPCPRGTPNPDGAPTGTVITVERLPFAGCMAPSDANYKAWAEVHVPQLCALPQHYHRGCMLAGATNFAPGADEPTECSWPAAGCTDTGAINYQSWATTNDGSCITAVAGCTLVAAALSHLPTTNPTQAAGFYLNTGATASIVRSSTVLQTWPVTSSQVVTNYDPSANVLSGCTIAIEGCMDPTMVNYDSAATVNTGTWCIPATPGCMDPTALNYNSAVTVQTSCAYYSGCTDSTAINYVENLPSTYVFSSTCYYSRTGCLDPTAVNYGCTSPGGTVCTLGPTQQVTVHSQYLCSGSAPPPPAPVTPGAVYVAPTATEVAMEAVTNIVATSVSDALAALGTSGANTAVTATAQVVIKKVVVTQWPGGACGVSEQDKLTMAGSVASVGLSPNAIVTAYITEECVTPGRRLQTAAARVTWNIDTQVPQADAAAAESTMAASFTDASSLMAVVNSFVAAEVTAGRLSAAEASTFTSVVIETLDTVVTFAFFSPPPAGPPPPPYTATATSSSSSEEDNTGAIVGGVIGGIVGLILIVALIMYMQKQKKGYTAAVVPA